MPRHRWRCSTNGSGVSARPMSRIRSTPCPCCPGWNCAASMSADGGSMSRPMSARVSMTGRTPFSTSTTSTPWRGPARTRRSRTCWRRWRAYAEDRPVAQPPGLERSRRSRRPRPCGPCARPVRGSGGHAWPRACRACSCLAAARRSRRGFQHLHQDSRRLDRAAFWPPGREYARELQNPDPRRRNDRRRLSA